MPADTDNLREWYLNESKRVSLEKGKHKRRLFRLIKFYLGFVFILIGIFFLGIILMYLNHPDEQTRIYRQYFYVFQTLLVFITIIFLVFVFAKSSIQSVNTLKQKGSVIAFDPVKYRTAYLVIEEVSVLMELTTREIMLCLFISNNNYPSIEEDETGKITLLLPLAFIMMADQDSERFKAALCHEFGHIIQKDSDVYQIANAYYEVMRPIFVPSGISSIVYKAYILVKLDTMKNISEHSIEIISGFIGVTMIFDLAIVIFLLMESARLKRGRKYSELLADIASILYSGSAIVKILKENVNNAVSHNDYHPSPKARINNLRSTVTKFNISI